MSWTAYDLINFENGIKQLFEQGELPILLHLSGGNEQQLIDIFKNVRVGDWVFSTHRSHYHYLLAGGSPVRLHDTIVDGRSMFVFDKSINFFTSSIVAGVTAIAAGVALALQKSGSPNRVWCFIGDGAEDEGHTYEAIRFVDGNKLPCQFIIEDNDRSVESSINSRWGSSTRPVWPACVTRLVYEPTYPHGGTGCTQRVVFKPEAIERAKKWHIEP